MKLAEIYAKSSSGNTYSTEFDVYTLAATRSTMTVSLPPAKAARLALRLIAMLIRHPRTPVTFEAGSDNR